MNLAGAVRLEGRDTAPWMLPLAVVGAVGVLALRVVGLPGVDLHGPFHRRGIMDPLCGGTRATYLLAHGDVVGAWSWNPLAVLLAAAAALALGRVALWAVTRRWVNLYVPRRYAVAGLLLLLIAVEINQQLQADRLMTIRPA